MIPGMNPRDMAKAMKRLGIKQEEIDATEVIIKLADKDILIKHPQVVKVNAMGQETFQISGIIEEVQSASFTEEDVKTVATQAHVSEGKAKEALEETHGDLAQAILHLQK